ncbi:MAG: B12-binding domain-containing radical SAM protein [Nitrososphaerales archaeon]
MSEYRQLSLGDFLSCAPAEIIPPPAFYFLSPSIPSINGVALRAPYGLRKLEAALKIGYKPEDIVVAHPDYIQHFINSDTEIVGISTMDPFGLGPASMMFTLGGRWTAYSKKLFINLVKRIDDIRSIKGFKFKLVIGGSGAWQFEYNEDVIKELNIDNVIHGELDRVACNIFQKILDDSSPSIIHIHDFPSVDDIPTIINPSIHGIVEVMRGCGRNCEFCEPNLKRARYIPLEKILNEVRVNIRGGNDNVWVQSDDIFLYELEDHKNFMPNSDAILELFTKIMAEHGVHQSNPTHGSIAPVVADPLLIKQLSVVLKSGPERFVGIQPGMETGSSKLIAKYMPRKALPFQPEEWGDVVFEATKVFNENYWFPAYTLIMGFPEETSDDIWDTVRLLDLLEREIPRIMGEKAHFIAVPLSFVPTGVLKDEAFYYVNNMLDEAKICLLYRSWRHTVYEIGRLPKSIIKDPVLRLIFELTGRTALHLLKRFAIKKGYDVEKAMQVNYT